MTTTNCTQKEWANLASEVANTRPDIALMFGPGGINNFIKNGVTYKSPHAGALRTREVKPTVTTQVAPPRAAAAPAAPPAGGPPRPDSNGDALAALVARTLDKTPSEVDFTIPMQQLVAPQMGTARFTQGGDVLACLIEGAHDAH